MSKSVSGLLCDAGTYFVIEEKKESFWIFLLILLSSDILSQLQLGWNMPQCLQAYLISLNF